MLLFDTPLFPKLYTLFPFTYTQTYFIGTLKLGCTFVLLAQYFAGCNLKHFQILPLAESHQSKFIN